MDDVHGRPTLSGFREFCNTRPDDYEVPDRYTLSVVQQAFERLWQTEKDIQILRSKDFAYNSRDPQVVYRQFDHLTKGLDSPSREKLHRYIDVRLEKWLDDLSSMTSTHVAFTQKQIAHSAGSEADKSLTPDEIAFKARNDVMHWQADELHELQDGFEDNVHRKIEELHTVQEQRSTRAHDLNALLKARTEKARETDRDRDDERDR
jgi:hypothetical protein